MRQARFWFLLNGQDRQDVVIVVSPNDTPTSAAKWALQVLGDTHGPLRKRGIHLITGRYLPEAV